MAIYPHDRYVNFWDEYGRYTIQEPSKGTWVNGIEWGLRSNAIYKPASMDFMMGYHIGTYDRAIYIYRPIESNRTQPNPNRPILCYPILSYLCICTAFRIITILSLSAGFLWHYNRIILVEWYMNIAMGYSIKEVIYEFYIHKNERDCEVL